MNNQHRPTVYHMELCSMLCCSLDGRGVWGRMDTCINMTESLHCSPETITTLLIGYSQIQNKMLKKYCDQLFYMITAMLYLGIATSLFSSKYSLQVLSLSFQAWTINSRLFSWNLIHIYLFRINLDFLILSVSVTIKC